jgi:hypothetical protein
MAGDLRASCALKEADTGEHPRNRQRRLNRSIVPDLDIVSGLAHTGPRGLAFKRCYADGAFGRRNLLQGKVWATRLGEQDCVYDRLGIRRLRDT